MAAFQARNLRLRHSHTGMLLAVFEVLFGFDQFQCVLLYFLILYCVTHIPKAVDDIIADQGTVLFREFIVSIESCVSKDVHLHRLNGFCSAMHQ